MLACFENKQTTCTTETNSHIKISFLKKMFAGNDRNRKN